MCPSLQGWDIASLALHTLLGKSIWPVGSFIPFSHSGFCVSRLTAIGHMRHPYKGDIGKNEDDSSVRMCIRLPTSPTKLIKTERKR
jgi:hypothetical protein